MMAATGGRELENPAIDPAFVRPSAPSVAGNRTARRDCAPESSPLIEVFAMRYLVEARTAFPVFPTARPELLFHFGDPFRVRNHDGEPWFDLPRAALLGPRRHRYWQSAGPPIDWFLIQLTPLGCRRFLGASLGAWWDVDVALSALWGEVATTLHARLAGEPDFDMRRQIASAALAPLALDLEGDAAVSRAVHRARIGELQTPAAMAHEVGVGERRLRQRFAADYGWNPKAFLNLMRFNRQMLETHPLYPGNGLVDHADQSHAIHEFRRFAGITPGAYARMKAGGDLLVVTGAAQPA